MSVSNLKVQKFCIIQAKRIALPSADEQQTFCKCCRKPKEIDFFFFFFGREQQKNTMRVMCVIFVVFKSIDIL